MWAARATARAADLAPVLKEVRHGGITGFGRDGAGVDSMRHSNDG
jgi:hypothetical protein